ncbi:MAG: NAD(P)-dependent oxidoreductase [Patescibacteria group bacterium]
MLKNKKILVTGGTGFIGSNLIRRLIEEGALVYALTRETSNFWRLNDVLEKVRFNVSDLSDFDGITKLIEDIRPDGIFHLGATTIMQGIIAESGKAEEVNFKGTKNLVESMSPNCEFFINTGTFSDISGTDDYAKSKLHAAEFASDFGKKNGKPVVTLRLFSPYGPYIQKGRLIFNVLIKAMAGEDIEMASPEIIRDFIYVDDLVDLYISVAKNAKENPGGIFDAGSGVATTLQEVADNALKITGSKSKIIWGSLQKLSYDSGKMRSDVEKTTSRLGWHPKTNLFLGMQKTFKWLKEKLSLYQ